MVGRRIFLLKWSKIQWTFNIRSFVESVFIRASSYSSTGVSGGHCNYRRSGEMPADFSSLTVAEQQALMDASMSGEVEGSVHVMRQRFLEYPKVLKTCTKFKLGHSIGIKDSFSIFWVKPCEKPIVFLHPIPEVRRLLLWKIWIICPLKKRDLVVL